MKVVRQVAVFLSLCGALTACETMGVATGETGLSAAGVATQAAATVEVPASPGEAQLLRFVSEEAVGAQAVIDDTRSGSVYIALIDREYVSARGRLCKQISLERAAGGRLAGGGEAPRRVACQVEAGWQLVRPLMGTAAL